MRTHQQELTIRAIALLESGQTPSVASILTGEEESVWTEAKTYNNFCDIDDEDLETAINYYTSILKGETTIHEFIWQFVFRCAENKTFALCLINKIETYPIELIKAIEEPKGEFFSKENMWRMLDGYEQKVALRILNLLEICSDWRHARTRELTARSVALIEINKSVEDAEKEITPAMAAKATREDIYVWDVAKNLNDFIEIDETTKALIQRYTQRLQAC